MAHAPQDIRTFFVTASTWGRRALFRAEPLAQLFLRTIADYRANRKFLLHEFVLMPDHFHMILTPTPDIPLERAVQFVKGGYSFRVKKELGKSLEIWSAGFSEHRIKDAADYRNHQEYIWNNPVRARLAQRAEQYPYSSAAAGFDLDPAPPGLKPVTVAAALSPG